MTIARIIIVSFLLLFAFAPISVAQTTKPVSPELTKWFKQLDDKDADVRDAARTQLMMIPRSRLAELQRVVNAARPLAPAQIVELRQIVQHVFLTGEPYPVDAAASSGFLGVRTFAITVPVAHEDPNVPPGSYARVMIISRLPGFAAYPVLRDGDVIERITDANNHEPIPVDPRSFTTALAQVSAGSTVKIQIQRGGIRMQVTVKLSRRPASGKVNTTGTTQGEAEARQFLEDRDAAASDFWDSTFGKMLEQQTM